MHTSAGLYDFSVRKAAGDDEEAMLSLAACVPHARVAQKVRCRHFASHARVAQNVCCRHFAPHTHPPACRTRASRKMCAAVALWRTGIRASVSSATFQMVHLSTAATWASLRGLFGCCACARHVTPTQCRRLRCHCQRCRCSAGACDAAASAANAVRVLAPTLPTRCRCLRCRCQRCHTHPWHAPPPPPRRWLQGHRRLAALAAQPRATRHRGPRWRRAAAAPQRRRGRLLR